MKKRVGSKRIIHSSVTSAFSNRTGIWWYRISDGKLEYSEAAATHLDYKRFTLLNGGWRGLARGLVFMKDGKRSIFIYMQDPVMRNAVDPDKHITDIKNKISKKIGFPISGIVDEDGHYCARHTDV